VAQVVLKPQDGGPGLSQKAPPVIKLPAGCTLGDLEHCVPGYVGDEPIQTEFSLPHNFTAADCQTPTKGMPGNRFTYPGTTDQQHVWCPQTLAQLRQIMEGGVPGSTQWSQGDIIALQPQGPTGSLVYRSNSQMRSPSNYGMWTRTRNVTNSDLAFPPSDNPNRKYSYLITMNYAQLPLPGNRVRPADRPNMAKLEAVGNQTGLYFGPHVNHWRIVGVELTSISTNGTANVTAPYWFRGVAGSLAFLESWNATNGKRDLWAMNGGNTDCITNSNAVMANVVNKSYCDYLGGAIEVSMYGQGAIVGVSPKTIPVDTANVNIVITTEDSHMCDNVNVQCASVGSDAPTYSAFGYGIIVKANIVNNVTCPAGVGGTCQTLTAVVDVAQNAAATRYVNPRGRPIGNLLYRGPYIITERGLAGHPDERMFYRAGLSLTGPGIPTVTGVQNVTYQNKPIVVIDNSANVQVAIPQTLKISTSNTTMTTAPGGITAAMIGIANGTTTIPVTGASVVSDIEVDANINWPNNGFAAGGRLNTLVVQGASAPAPGVPIAADPTGGQSLFLIPSQNTNSWIQSIDCYVVLPGETYTCHVIGANTQWAQGTTTFQFTSILLPDGTPDIQITNTQIIDATDATLTVVLDSRASAGADHIVFDRIDAHGKTVRMRKNTLDGTTPYIWEADPQNGPYTQDIRDVIVLGGKYVGVRDSRLGDAHYCQGNTDSGIGSYSQWAGWGTRWCGAGSVETHAVGNPWGPGPLWLNNNEFYNTSINVFNGGAGGSSTFAVNVQAQDFVYIHNYSHYDSNFQAASIMQTLQDANRNPITHYTIGVDAGGHITGVSGTGPHGFNYCPTVRIYAQGRPAQGSGGQIGCMVQNPGPNGTLSFGVIQPGSGYTIAPKIGLFIVQIAGMKNAYETKGVNRMLFYGNTASNSWGNSMLNQNGTGFLMNTITGFSDGPAMAYTKNLYIKDNWFDKTWANIGLGGPNTCSSYTPSQMADTMNCITPTDPFGSFPNVNSSDLGAYTSGLPNGGFTSGVRIENNLATMRDEADDQAVIDYSVWNSSIYQSSMGIVSNDARGLTLATVAGVAFIHNTIEKRPPYTKSHASGIWVETDNPALAAGQLYTSFFPGTNKTSSIEWNSYIWSNVTPCLIQGSALPPTQRSVQAAFACPTKYGDTSQNCNATIPLPLGGGETWQHKFWGNVLYVDRSPESGHCAFDTNPTTAAGYDWTFGGATNNKSLTSSTTLQASHYANTGLYIPGQRPGDWTLTDPNVVGTVTGQDGLTPGINNAELMAAIGQTVPTDIPKAISGIWVQPLTGAAAVSGTVSGAVLAGVTISLIGPSTQSTTTDSSGNYNFTNLPDGSYTVTPIMPSRIFAPTNASVTISGQANQVVPSFVASQFPSTGNISGTITGATGVRQSL
jgi:hypothetical protein